MPRTKHKEEYKHNIKIPNAIWTRTQKLIDKYPDDFGYRSPSEFGIAVIRNRLEEYERKYNPEFEEKHKDKLRKLLSGLGDK